MNSVAITRHCEPALAGADNRGGVGALFIVVDLEGKDGPWLFFNCQSHCAARDA
jgi:hypothetical protein